MALVRLEEAARQFRTEPIWQNVNLNLEFGDRIGIIGSNGCGKSTLLKVIAGIDAPDYGKALFKPDLTKGYLPQTPDFEPQLTIREAVTLSQKHITDKIKEYEEACSLYAESPSSENERKMERLNAQLNSMQAWDLKQRTEGMLSQLGLDKVSQNIGQLSQGMRKKIAIGIALLNNPEILLLDEPTNHLDTVTIDWLENQLNLFKGCIVLVTHDRYFLDKLAGKILELDRGRAIEYQGNYAQYLEQKAYALELAGAEDEKRQNLIRREMAWFKRGARARSTKQKARQERLTQLLEQHQQQHNLLGRAESSVSLNSFQTSKRLGNKGINLYNINKSFADRPVIRNFSLKISKGDRLGFVGPNGCGKSTLLNIIAEHLKPDSGHIEFGETVQIGYYTQSSLEADRDLTIIDYVREGGDYIYTSDGRQVSAENLLEQFLFPRRIQHDQLSKLSGGERKRLRLLRLLMQSPNCLLLDEPTNDLDIPTLIRLEAWLDDFPGAVIIVSHDRYFLDRCADRLFYFERNRVQEFLGDYETLRQHINASAQTQLENLQQKESKPQPAAALAQAAPVQKKKATYKQKTRFNEIEKLISQKEDRQNELQNIMSNPTGQEDLTSLGLEFERISEELIQLMEEWEELAAIME